MIRCFNELDDTMFAFAANATVMHHNVNTEKGLTFLTLENNDLTFKAEPNWPRSENINNMKLIV